MIAKFPTFSKVTLQDKLFFDEFNAQFPPYADWAFGTLLIWWDIFDDLEAAQLDGNIIIKSSYISMGKEPCLTLLGNHNVDEVMQTLFKYQKDNGMNQVLYSLPQYTLDAISGDRNQYIIVDDPDAAEYICSTNKLSTLEGEGLKRFRKAVHHFERSMEGHTLDIAHVELNSLPAKMLLINGLHTWADVYDNDRERLEGLALDRSLYIAEHIGLESLCVFIDKKLAGFILYKRLSERYANINHIKGSRDYPDLFRYLTHVIAIELEKEGYEFSNGEQDLGIEGLRRYKTSLMPTTKFYKYNVYPVEP